MIVPCNSLFIFCAVFRVFPFLSTHLGSTPPLAARSFHSPKAGAAAKNRIATSHFISHLHATRPFVRLSVCPSA
ncbi:hypothetical protein B0J18DRAFT_194599 [Chaetomium sp. MPI-SDFR-AT-0129]|nr:hypothetical protein B0J18DRAFT_194599 [Chaetomium sp. MPI-SDFR-AT-0129]